MIDESRRRFLAGAGVGFGALLAACRGDGAAPTAVTSTTETPPVTLPAVDHGTPVGDDPFGLGVASGDPDHESVVVWTWADRDGPAALTLEIALDDAFAGVVQRHEVLTDPAAGGTARLLVAGLAADRVHWYRFVLDGHVTPPARARTAPAADAVPDQPLRVAHLSCQRHASGYWTALTDVASAEPDLVVHCGDYVYEADGQGVRAFPDQPRRAPTDLEGYRALWRRYKREPELRAAHLVAPWLVVWDDHEVENNYQGDDPGGKGGTPGDPAFLARRAAAYRAWWEFTPTRLAPPDGASLPIHRTVDWGRLTRFVLLDTRQYRDDQPCPDDIGTDLGARCEGSATTTMLGADQEAWFDRVATDHQAAWTTVVQQVVVHQWRFVPGNVVWNLDQWDGYPGARTRLLDVLGRAPSPVVLTGDVHSSWVSDLPTDFDADDAPSVGVEFVAPGVSSEAPSVLRQAGTFIEALSPHIVWSETRRRGWVLHEITPDRWTATYRHVSDASVPESPVDEAGTFTVDVDARTVDG